LLDAQLVVTGPAGTRTIDYADWMLGAFTTALESDDVLTGVRIASLSPSARWSYRKLNRKPGEFAEAIAAFVVDPDRGIVRGVIGATDGAPHVIADASAFMGAWRPDVAAVALRSAGLAPGSYEHRVHAVTLQRAAADLNNAQRQAA
jgi:aerobic carbon-monoxide dehydrogenase medium subunit